MGNLANNPFDPNDPKLNTNNSCNKKTRKIYTLFIVDVPPGRRKLLLPQTSKCFRKQVYTDFVPGHLPFPRPMHTGYGNAHRILWYLKRNFTAVPLVIHIRRNLLLYRSPFSWALIGDPSLTRCKEIYFCIYRLRFVIYESLHSWENIIP